MTNNSSNDSFMPPEDSSADFSYLALLNILFFHIPVFIVNILLLVAIITEKTIPATVKLILGNIVASIEVVIIALFTLLMYDLILPLVFNPSPSIFLCKLLFALIASGAAGRLLFMATYAVTVYVFTRYAGTNLRVSKLRLWPSLLAVAVIWVFATAPNMVLLSSAFFEITFTTNLVCVPHGMGATTLVYTITYIFVYGVCCFILSIVFPILTVRYLKATTISEDKKQTVKRMTRFAVFLLIGNSFNIAGASLPSILAIFTPVGEEKNTLVTALIFLEQILLGLSLLTTPIVLLIVFKSVRERFKKITCFVCLRATAEKPQHQQSTTEDTTGSTKC